MPTPPPRSAPALPAASDLGHGQARRWLVSFLKAVLDGYPRSHERVAEFMRLYAARPTLQTLGRGAPTMAYCRVAPAFR
jgi:hypothetical protein